MGSLGHHRRRVILIPSNAGTRHYPPCGARTCGACSEAGVAFRSCLSAVEARSKRGGRCCWGCVVVVFGRPRKSHTSVGRHKKGGWQSIDVKQTSQDARQTNTQNTQWLKLPRIDMCFLKKTRRRATRARGTFFRGKFRADSGGLSNQQSRQEMKPPPTPPAERGSLRLTGSVSPPANNRSIDRSNIGRLNQL
jgi:hypothetical protein